MPRYHVEALEKFIHRNYYTVEADSEEEAIKLCQSGEVAYECTEVEEGDEEWISTESVVLEADPAPGPDNHNFHKGFSEDGCELSSGGVIEYPDADGTIRYRDCHGNCEDARRIGDEGWQEWADLFDKTEEDFASEEDDDEDS